jgi:hypothetical protein
MHIHKYAHAWMHTQMLACKDTHTPKRASISSTRNTSIISPAILIKLSTFDSQLHATCAHIHLDNLPSSFLPPFLTIKMSTATSQYIHTRESPRQSALLISPAIFNYQNVNCNITIHTHTRVTSTICPPHFSRHFSCTRLGHAIQAEH